MDDPRGCRAHGVLAEAVESRWNDAEALCRDAAGDDEDEFNAQADRIGVCICCFGPTLDSDSSLCRLCFVY